MPTVPPIWALHLFESTTPIRRSDANGDHWSARSTNRKDAEGLGKGILKESRIGRGDVELVKVHVVVSNDRRTAS